MLVVVLVLVLALVMVLFLLLLLLLMLWLYAFVAVNADSSHCFCLFMLSPLLSLLLFSTIVLLLEGRVLELLVLLDEQWQKHRLGSYKLVLLHNTAFNTGEFAKSQVNDLKSNFADFER